MSSAILHCTASLLLPLLLCCIAIVIVVVIAIGIVVTTPPTGPPPSIECSLFELHLQPLAPQNSLTSHIPCSVGLEIWIRDYFWIDFRRLLELP